jgi:uncharacterized protein YqjF (DUF2071 family)
MRSHGPNHCGKRSRPALSEHLIRCPGDDRWAGQGGLPQASRPPPASASPPHELKLPPAVVGDVSVNLAPTPAQRLGDRQRPDRVVVLKQRWERLLFLHWRWDPAEVQASLPAGLTVDTREGAAWLGLVPLFMRDVRPTFVPELLASNFYELNLRTYVYDGRGRPGVYFYSLDCNQPLVVEGARRVLNLRYEHCRIEASVDGDGVVDFTARRPRARLKSHFRYQAIGAAAEAEAESLEFFLVERYRLFAAAPDGGVTTIRVAHAPYRLSQPMVFDWSDVPLRQAKFSATKRDPDHVIAAEPVNVDTFAPEPVDG